MFLTPGQRQYYYALYPYLVLLCMISVRWELSRHVPDPRAETVLQYSVPITSFVVYNFSMMGAI